MKIKGTHPWGGVSLTGRSTLSYEHLSLSLELGSVNRSNTGFVPYCIHANVDTLLRYACYDLISEHYASSDGHEAPDRASGSFIRVFTLFSPVMTLGNSQRHCMGAVRG